MNKIIHYLGLDVHKETIAVSIAQKGSKRGRFLVLITEDSYSNTPLRQRYSRLFT